MFKLSKFNDTKDIILLYYSTRMTKGEDKLDTFQQKCLRKILKIHWPMKVTNEEGREGTRSERITTQSMRLQILVLSVNLNILVH